MKDSFGFVNNNENKIDNFLSAYQDCDYLIKNTVKPGNIVKYSIL